MKIQALRRHGSTQLQFYPDPILPPMVADTVRQAVSEHGFLLPRTGGPWDGLALADIIERHYTPQPDAADGSCFSFAPQPLTDRAQAMINVLRLAGIDNERWREQRYHQPPTALILSCSDRKVGERGRAIDLYDGNMVRIVRERKPRVQLFFLSTKYGLIEAETVIDSYDQTIDKAAWQPWQMTHQWVQSLLWRDAPTGQVYACMGQAYYSRLLEMAVAATNWYGLRWPRLERLPLAGGSIGKMQSALVEFCTAHQDEALPVPGWQHD